MPVYHAHFFISLELRSALIEEFDLRAGRILSAFPDPSQTVAFPTGRAHHCARIVCTSPTEVSNIRGASLAPDAEGVVLPGQDPRGISDRLDGNDTFHETV